MTVVSISFSGAPSPAVERSGDSGELPRRSTWMRIIDPSEYMVLLGFSGDQAAQEDLRLLMEADRSTDPNQNFPTEVHYISIDQEQGHVLDDVPIGGYMVVAKALASPGFGDVDRQTTEDALVTFTQLENYCGHLTGFNESIEDETWSFIFGSSRSTVPFPDNAEVRLRVYQRAS